MANVEAFIWHDAQGNIVAVGHLIAEVEESIEPRAKPHHKILKLHMPEEHLSSLHLTHAVDVERGVLRTRNPPEESPPTMQSS
jgi:hypothetical protein